MCMPYYYLQIRIDSYSNHRHPFHKNDNKKQSTCDCMCEEYNTLKFYLVILPYLNTESIQ